MSGGTWHTFDISGDVGIETTGPDIAGVFVALAEAFTALATDPGAVECRTRHAVDVTAPDLGALAVAWLNELVFLQDTERFLPRKTRIRIAAVTRIVADLEGDRFDPRRHERRYLVKAATFHGLVAEGLDDSVRIRVILDL